MSPAPHAGRLEAVGISKRFGGLIAVNNVTVWTSAGSIAALIGPNGAGKTTLFHCLTGVETPDRGKVRLMGRDITALSSDARARLGVGRTFQRLEIFPTLTVGENLQVGADNRTTAHMAHRIGGLFAGLIGVTFGDQRRNRNRVDEVVELLGLDDVRDTPAETLSTGTLRLVELGRALCHDPTVLLLDEPASGLDTTETQRLQQVLRDVASTNVAILLVEHDVDLVFGLADRVYAMAEGRLIASGSADEVRESAAVREAYLDVEPA
ncbi:MAG TPA: ABC transporter ATP-binding protein [Mycobacteriales bacterium]|nr:ABC transporter ATP-binding protein [Mycobacteriales bacterium]